MRIALVVGINFYEHTSPLHGCVSDAHSVHAVLDRHGDGTKNFDCQLLTGTGPAELAPRSVVKDSVEDLFKTDAEIALFYFAGHGHIEATGGYLLGSDAKRGDDGIALGEILTLANRSPAKNRVVILDSCHSGIAGNPPTTSEMAMLTEGVTVLTASTKDQYATESCGKGVFTSLLVDALSGGAANLTGDITPGSIYAHIDQSLGAWEQRPVFKTNVKQFVSLRKVRPPIDLADLRRIAEFFPTEGYVFQLDPSFEPESKGRERGMPEPDPANTEIFGLLQKYNRLNLLVPVDAPHMWNAAMESKACKLTVLGEHYRNLVMKKRI